MKIIKLCIYETFNFLMTTFIFFKSIIIFNLTKLKLCNIENNFLNKRINIIDSRLKYSKFH